MNRFNAIHGRSFVGWEVELTPRPYVAASDANKAADRQIKPLRYELCSLVFGEIALVEASA